MLFYSRTYSARVLPHPCSLFATHPNRLKPGTLLARPSIQKGQTKPRSRRWRRKVDLQSLLGEPGGPITRAPNLIKLGQAGGVRQALV